jgi:hypothetical protein
MYRSLQVLIIAALRLRAAVRTTRGKTTMKYFLLILTALLATGVSGGQVLAQEEEVEAEDAKRCINIRRIRSTAIVDDSNIIFYETGNKAYHNILPRQCIGLKREGRFTYKTSASQLCDLDNISVLMSGARGLQPGRSCGLGLFHPISAEQADALRNPEPQDVPPQEIETAEPEEIGADEEKES